jgi:hypothetical protein
MRTTKVLVTTVYSRSYDTSSVHTTVLEFDIIAEADEAVARIEAANKTCKPFQQFALRLN